MKQKKKAGLTMVELLCALAVLLLVAACMVVGVSLAVRSYDRSLASSEAQVLCATLQTTVSDELRYSGTLFYDQTGRLTGFFSQEHGGEDAKDAEPQEEADPFAEPDGDEDSSATRVLNLDDLQFGRNYTRE